MLHVHAAVCCLVTTLCVPALAQQPDPAPSARPAPAAKSDSLRSAFVDADGHRRITIAAAAEQMLASDAAGRARFMEVLRAVAAVAPKPVAAESPAPKPAATEPPKPETGTTEAGTTKPGKPATSPTPEAKPNEFADAIKQLMTEVVTSSPEASKAALARLAEDKEVGPAALARLDERGKAILERGVASLIRKKIQTGALYEGQYSELANFQPEAEALLLRWAQDAPKDVGNAEPFNSACVRALRDVVPAEKATETLREGMRGIATKAQKASKQTLFLTAACALHQFGDASLFDKVKTAVAARANSENAEEKIGATSTLADLHYQLRQYEEAANYYKSYVEQVEKAGQQPPNLPTMMYNAACSFSLAKKTDEGLQYLEKALQVSKGANLTKAMIDEDRDMTNLRADPRFQKLMDQFFAKPAAPKDK